MLYTVGNYHAILMKIGKQAKKNMLSSKITEADAYDKNDIALKGQRCMSAKL
jgi:hypothetical protein